MLVASQWSERLPERRGIAHTFANELGIARRLYARGDAEAGEEPILERGVEVRAIAEARLVEERSEIEARDEARLAHVDERDRLGAGDREGGAVAVEGRGEAGERDREAHAATVVDEVLRQSDETAIRAERERSRRVVGDEAELFAQRLALGLRFLDDLGRPFSAVVVEGERFDRPSARTTGRLPW